MSEWRAGRTLGKTLYVGPDDMVGVMMTRELAAYVVERVNGDAAQAAAAGLRAALDALVAALDGNGFDWSWPEANDALQMARAVLGGGE